MKKNSIKETIFLFIIGVCFVVVGIGVLYSGVSSIKEANESRNWPIITGLVISSQAHSQKQQSDVDEVIYLAKIKYSYKVKETIYNNDTVSFSQYRTSNRNYVQDELKKYPVGAKVDVYYNPNNPQIAVLEPRWGLINVVSLVIGFIILIIGGMIARNGIIKP